MKKSDSITGFQLSVNFDIPDSCSDVFLEILDQPSAIHLKPCQLILKALRFDTILGEMIAVSDDEKLYFLEFSDNQKLSVHFERLKLITKSIIIPEEAKPITKIKKELTRYFLGELQTFKTPLFLIGSDFEKKAWQALLQIPYGQTRSYLMQAKAIGNAKAFRAVANANGVNQLAVIIPCHRIIQQSGDLGGYYGGKARKKWLIGHEKKQA